MTVALEGPKQSDGSPFFSPCIFQSGVYLCFTGCADSGSAVGGGEKFTIVNSGSGDMSLTWKFVDVVFLAGGACVYDGAQVGDHVTMEVYAPVTPVTPNASGTGNADIDLSGIIVPSDGSGSYDVDLGLAVPVPAIGSDGSYCGYWDCASAATGSWAVSPGLTPGSSHWHLVPAEVVLTRYVNCVQMLGSNHVQLIIPAIEPKAWLPQWRGRVTVHNDVGGHTVSFVWKLTIGRYRTV